MSGKMFAKLQQTNCHPHSNLINTSTIMTTLIVSGIDQKQGIGALPRALSTETDGTMRCFTYSVMGKGIDRIRGTNNMVNNLIERQAAIGSAISGMTMTIGGEKWIRVSEVRESLYSVPSVQPERTCVNCGRTANNGGWYADGGTRCPIEEHYALPKDGYCHLWEKRNVTDDDYPEGRADE